MRLVVRNNNDDPSMTNVLPINELCASIFLIDLYGISAAYKARGIFSLFLLNT